jgi:hypothetical protein
MFARPRRPGSACSSSWPWPRWASSTWAESIWYDEASASAWRRPTADPVSHHPRYEFNMAFYLSAPPVGSLGQVNSPSEACRRCAMLTYGGLRPRFPALQPGYGLLAALLLTVNPFFIEIAQLARGYSLLLMLAALSSLLFVTGMRDIPMGVGGVRHHQRPGHYTLSRRLRPAVHVLSHLFLPAGDTVAVVLKTPRPSPSSCCPWFTITTANGLTWTG